MKVCPSCQVLYSGLARTCQNSLCRGHTPYGQLEDYDDGVARYVVRLPDGRYYWDRGSVISAAVAQKFTLAGAIKVAAEVTGTVEVA